MGHFPPVILRLKRIKFMKGLKYFKYLNLSEEEMDKRLFRKTKYKGMKFTLEGDWTNLYEDYASPVFVFENGDRVVFDRRGELVVLDSFEEMLKSPDSNKMDVGDREVFDKFCEEANEHIEDYL